MSKKLPRGLRLNNPGNIRKGSSRWKGAVRKNPDKEFVKFDSMLSGYRAMWIVLSNYYHVHHRYTIRSMLSRWAPPKENNTEAYIQFVSKYAQADPNEVLPDPKSEADSPLKEGSRGQVWLRIIIAMTMMEQGVKDEEVDQSTIREAYKRAFHLDLRH